MTMAYVITEPCIDVKDKACVEVCPVDCIYEGPNQLFIHPDECIDCGACEPVCPVKAIFTEDETPEPSKHVIELTQIAEEFNIPSELLAKILQRLAKRRLIVAIRRAATGSRPNRRSSRSGKWCGRWRGRSRLLPLPEQHDARLRPAGPPGRVHVRQFECQVDLPVPHIPFPARAGQEYVLQGVTLSTTAKTREPAATREAAW